MQFDIPTDDVLYPYITEEERIEYEDIFYNIKTVNERKTVSTINAEIDLDDLKANIFLSFNYHTITLSQALSYALAGTGWTVNGAGIVSAKRSFELVDVTPLDIVNKCTEKTMYNISFDVDNKNKILNVSVPSSISGNVYFTDQLNLKEINFKGSSTNLVTRLYAYGKDGLSIADVNGGKEYVDNNIYSDKIISAVWRDERYTIAANLLEAAKIKLEELAVPERSYSCNVIDIARLDNVSYQDFYIRLNSKITLIDRRRKKRLEHTVVEMKEYPNEPSKNTVTLSTAPQKISKKLLNGQIQLNNVNAQVMSQPSKWQQAIENATALITGADGGYIVLNISSENPEEILIMNTPDINTATKVWRWNKNGLGYSSNGYSGPYTLAMTIDGAIVADFITTGILNADLIKTGVLEGIKIIATAGSIAGWTLDGTKLVSSSGGIELDSHGGTGGLGSISIHNLMTLSELGIELYDLSGNQLGGLGRATINTGTESKYGIGITLTDNAKNFSVSVWDETRRVYVDKLRYDVDSDTIETFCTTKIHGDISAGNLVTGITTDGIAPVTGSFWAIKSMTTDAEGKITSLTTGTVNVHNGLITSW